MKIQTTIDINASTTEVWQVLGEQFGDVADFADAIVKSSLDRPLDEGAVRTCDLKAFGPVPAGKITEELTEFDRESQSMTYVVRSGMPGFMRFTENAWTIEPLDDNRSRVTSRATFRLAWYMLPMSPLLRIQMKKGIRAFVTQLDSAVVSSQEAALPKEAHAS